MARPYQTVSDRVLDRKDHVWFRCERPVRWLCVLCGGSTTQPPPAYPTPPDWLPERTEKLTDDDRNLCPLEVRV